MNEIKCEVCGNPVKIKETWGEINEEYRHLEYSYCDTCGNIRDVTGKPLFPEQPPAKPLDLF